MYMSNLNFSLTINGKTIDDFSLEKIRDMRFSELKDRTPAERVEDVRKLLENDHDFFECFFSKWYTAKPNKENYLSQDTVIFMKLERLADYILGFGDKHTSKEIPLADSLRPKVNFKKSKKQKITSADLEDKELTIVAAYHQYQKQLQGKEKEVSAMLRLKDLAEGRTPKKNYHFEAKRWIRNTQKECSYDKLILKDQIKGTIYFKFLSPESEEIDIEQFDPQNIRHVKAAICCPPRSLFQDDTISVLLFTVHGYLRQIRLDSRERNILQDIWAGSSQREVAAKQHISQAAVSQSIYNIARRVMRQMI